MKTKYLILVAVLSVMLVGGATLFFLLRNTDPTFDCSSDVNCKFSIKEMKEQLKVDSRTMNNNIRLYTQIMAVLKFKDEPTAKNAELVASRFRRHNMGQENSGFAFRNSVLDKKTYQEIKDVIKANLPIADDISSLERWIDWDLSSAKASLSTCLTMVGEKDYKTLCTTDNKGDPKVASYFKNIKDFEVKDGVIRGEFKGNGYTLKLKSTSEKDPKFHDLTWKDEFSN